MPSKPSCVGGARGRRASELGVQGEVTECPGYRCWGEAPGNLSSLCSSFEKLRLGVFVVVVLFL